MRLSRTLGRTKAELLDSLSEDELVEQIAFDHIEPMDNPYWRNGLLCEVLSHVMGSGKGQLKPEKWMPTSKEKRKMSNAEMKSNMLGLANRLK